MDLDNRLLINRPLDPARTDSSQNTHNQKSIAEDQPERSFKEIFSERLQGKEEIKFSGHARKRILKRNIELNDSQLEQLSSGVEKLEEKGARTSLVMVDEVAYVVSVKNKTVITAIDDENIKENVFTNIDSAVMM